MYDKTKPYNQLPLLPPGADLNTVRVLKLANRAGVELARFNEQVADSKLMFVSALLLIDHFAVFEAVGSSKIEHIITTSEEVFEAKALPEADRTDAQKETLRYVGALTHGAQLLRDKGHLNTNAYIDIQKTLEPSRTGIRRLPGTQIKNALTGEVFFTPPEGETLIRDLLHNYEDYYNDQTSEVDALIRMAVLHYQFEAIHPFYDGNGRTGRILLPLYLMSQDRLRYPILFISGYILQHQSEYYASLRRVTSHGEWEEWVLYMLEAVRQQARQTREYLAAIIGFAGEMNDILMRKVPKLASPERVEYLLLQPVFTRQEYAAEFDVSLNTATSHLKQLAGADLVHAEKIKNSKLYYNRPLLGLMKEFHMSR
jgi:Fic family protein